MIIALRENLLRIFDTYEEIIEKNPYSKITEIWEPFTSLEISIEEYLKSNLVTMHVNWSVGKGNWRKEPWIAILDERITNTVQKGYCCGYGFFFNLGTVSLGLTLGVNEIKNQVGRKRIRELLSQKAMDMRPFFSNLSDYGFTFNHKQLRSEYETTQDAISGNVLNKIYQGDNLPSDEELTQDLIHLLSEYDKYIENSLLEQTKS